MPSPPRLVCGKVGAATTKPAAAQRVSSVGVVGRPAAQAVAEHHHREPAAGARPPTASRAAGRARSPGTRASPAGAGASRFSFSWRTPTAKLRSGRSRRGPAVAGVAAGGGSAGAGRRRSAGIRASSRPGRAVSRAAASSAGGDATGHGSIVPRAGGRPASDRGVPAGTGSPPATGPVRGDRRDDRRPAGRAPARVAVSVGAAGVRSVGALGAPARPPGRRRASSAGSRWWSASTWSKPGRPGSQVLAVALAGQRRGTPPARVHPVVRGPADVQRHDRVGRAVHEEQRRRRPGEAAGQAAAGDHDAGAQPGRVARGEHAGAGEAARRVPGRGDPAGSRCPASGSSRRASSRIRCLDHPPARRPAGADVGPRSNRRAPRGWCAGRWARPPRTRRPPSGWSARRAARAGCAARGCRRPAGTARRRPRARPAAGYQTVTGSGRGRPRRRRSSVRTPTAYAPGASAAGAGRSRRGGGGRCAAAHGEHREQRDDQSRQPPDPCTVGGRRPSGPTVRIGPRPPPGRISPLGRSVPGGSPGSVRGAGFAMVVGMPDDYADPSGNTEAFRAFARSEPAAPAEAGVRTAADRRRGRGRGAAGRRRRWSPSTLSRLSSSASAGGRDHRRRVCRAISRSSSVPTTQTVDLGAVG